MYTDIKKKKNENEQQPAQKMLAQKNGTDQAGNTCERTVSNLKSGVRDGQMDYRETWRSLSTRLISKTIKISISITGTLMIIQTS